ACVTPPKQKDKGRESSSSPISLCQTKSSAQPQVKNANHVTIEKLQIVARSLGTKKNNPIQEEKEACVPKVNTIQAEASPCPVVVGTPSAPIKEVQKQEVISQIATHNQNQISNLNEEAEIFVMEVERNEESAEKVGSSNVSNSRDDLTLRQEASTQEQPLYF
ncbi:hypothetical protein ACH5RR_018469, partial [Cinchona calisaya]